MTLTADERGNYRLECGSIIYKSGNDYFDSERYRQVKAPNPGKYMLWVKTGHNGATATGHIEMDAKGPRYFDSPIGALTFLQNAQERKKK